MDWHYAYNFWRRIFVDSSKGRFTEADFDQWFHNGSMSDDRPIGLVPVGGQYDQQSHFFNTNRAAFAAMLDACAEGRFGRTPK